MKQCNRCDSGSCRVMSDYRKHRIEMSPEEMGFECKLHIEPPALTSTIFMTAMFNYPQKVYDLLETLGLMIVDQKRKPYFKIV